MKFTFIFFLLFCFHIRSFHTTQNDESTVGDRGITENTDPDSTKNSNKRPKEVKSTKLQEPRSLPLGLFPSLELIRKKENKRFEIRRDFIPLWEIKEDIKMVYFCPAESSDEYAIEEIITYKYCLFLKEKSNAALSSIQCTHEVEPKLWNYPDYENTCGEGYKGVRYRFLHQVDKLANLRDDFVQVYSICMLKQEELFYLKYNLIVPAPDEYQNTRRSYELQFQTDGYVQLNFEKVKFFFEKTEQNIILKRVFGEKFSDTLIPQMLISPQHIKPRIAGNSLHNYLNIKPQWKSLEEDWLKLEIHLWKIGIEHWKDVTVYAGTYDVIRKNNREVYFQVDENTKQNIPLVWWKLIVKNRREGIILAMQNVPKGYPNFMGGKLCQKSICNSHGWKEISEIVYCCAFNETIRKLLNLQEEKFKIRKVFDPASSKYLWIPKWIRHLLKL